MNALVTVGCSLNSTGIHQNPSNRSNQPRPGKPGCYNRAMSCSALLKRRRSSSSVSKYNSRSTDGSPQERRRLFSGSRNSSKHTSPVKKEVLKEKARRQRSFNVVQHNDRVQKGAASPGTEFFRVNIIDSEGGFDETYFGCSRPKSLNKNPSVQFTKSASMNSITRPNNPLKEKCLKKRNTVVPTVELGLRLDLTPVPGPRVDKPLLVDALVLNGLTPIVENCILNPISENDLKIKNSSKTNLLTPSHLVNYGRETPLKRLGSFQLELLDIPKSKSKSINTESSNSCLRTSPITSFEIFTPSSDVSYDLWCSTTGSPQVLRPSVSNISLKTNYPTTTLVNSSSSHQNKPQGSCTAYCTGSCNAHCTACSKQTERTALIRLKPTKQKKVTIKRRINITKFHIHCAVGMVGFVLFWTLILLRIFLPSSYWTWTSTDISGTLSKSWRNWKEFARFSPHLEIDTSHKNQE